MKLSNRIAGPCWLVGSLTLAACAGSISDPSDLGSDDVDTTDVTGSDATDDGVAGGTNLPQGALNPGRGFGKSIGNLELPATEHDTLRYIVKFKDAAATPLKTMSALQRKNLIENNRLEIVNRGGLVRAMLSRINAVSAELKADQVLDLVNSDKVEFVERDPVRTLIAPTATSAAIRPQAESVPYGITMVQANQLSDSAAAAKKICITDTGYDASHPDLRPRTGANLTGNDNDGSGNDTGNWYQDGAAHGTHVAGTIAALGGNGVGVVGVLPNDKIGLHIVKVFNNSGTWAYGSDMIAAIEQCVNAGADVISMSLGGPEQSTAERTAFEDASAQGVLSIAAAGNDGNTSFSYPASYDVVVSVAAVNSSKNLASFSQRNSQVELAAPGVGVTSTVPGGGYSSYDGTSMATPHVSGVAALVWSNHPECTNVEIRNALRATAEDRGSAGRDTSYGFGIVRAKAASDYLAANGCAGGGGGGGGDGSGGDGSGDGSTDPDPVEGELTNGTAISGLSGAAGAELRYFVRVPSGATNLNIAISGGSGDADLYVKRAAQPTTSSYDCRPYLSGNSESCTTAAPAADTYYVLVRGYAAFSGVSIKASYTTGSGGGTCAAGTYTATDTPLSIPDNNSAGVASTVNVTTTGTVATLTLTAAITHPYRGDLKVTLLSPSGAQYVLSNRAGGSADNLTLNGNVTGAVGQSARGAWKLLVQDLAAQDAGTLSSFKLAVTPTCP